MKDELKVFENRSDDWLAKERAYEAKISAWDLDEGKRIKAEHERAHSAYDRYNRSYGSLKRNVNVKNVRDYQLNPDVGKIIAIVIAVTVTILVTIGILAMTGSFTFGPFILIYLLFIVFGVKTRRRNK